MKEEFYGVQDIGTNEWFVMFDIMTIAGPFPPNDQGQAKANYLARALNSTLRGDCPPTFRVFS